MADEPSLNFKFSLDLSDFDKAPDRISSALASIEVDAKNHGKNADLEMAKFLQDLIKEREQAVANLSQQLEQATKDVAAAFANMEAGVVGADDEFANATKNMHDLEDAIEQTKKELELLNEKESEVAGNASFLTQLKMKAQGFDLYGKAMSMLPAPIANVIKSTKLLDGALKGLLANPIVLAIAGIITAIKALSGYADMMANKFETWTIIFGTITEAVRKFKEVITAIITLDWKDFVYNLTTMFDGGAREIQKRNEQLAQSERQVENEKLKAEIQVLNKRASNRKRSFDERIQAQKEANAKELKILENGLKDQAQAMRDFYIDNNLYHPEWNPKGLKTSEEEIDTAQRTQLNQLKAERMRLEAQVEAQKGLNEENLYKLRQQESDEWSKKIDQAIADMEKNIEAHRKRDQYQRQVREALEAEAERLQAMSTQTENMVIQSQIKEMADGIEKVTKEAQFKTKQAYEALDKTLVDEAKKLYNNEKAIYEGNPANEGKMFKAFKLDDYVRQARQNIGYGIRKELISNEEISTIKKAADDVANKALEGAKKVSEEVHKTFTELTKMSGVEAPSFMDSYDRFTTGIDDAIKATTSFKSITDEIEETQRNVLKLQMERLKLEVLINNTADPKEKVELAQKLEEADKSINVELEKGKRLLSDQSKAGEKVKTAYEKIKSNASQIVDAMSEIASQFKGISDAGDDMVDAMQQMMSFVGKIVSGDYLGAMLQVVMVIGKGIADTVKSIRHASDVSDETYEKMKKVSEATYALAQAAESYRMNMLDAKDAKDALYDTTNIKAMLDAQKKLNEATDNYQRYINSISVQNRRGTSKGFNAFVESINGIQVDMTPRNEFNKQYWDLNKYITTQFKSPLFSVDENGEYKLNTGIWKQIKENNDALALFNDTQVKQLDNIAQWQDKIVEAQQEVTSGIADWFSPLLDNMTDAMMDWLTANEDIMDRFKEYSSDTFRQIVEDLIKRMLYKDIFAKYTDEIDALTEEYLDTGNEQSYAQSIASVTDSLIQTLDDNKERSKAIWDAWESSMNEIGIDMNETAGRNAEARGIARASQESVDENNARLAMMQQHTYSINANVAQLVSYSASALEHLQGIHTNTNELRRLERIENSLANIETYGVRTR